MSKSLVCKTQTVLIKNWISQALCQAILVKRRQIQQLVSEAFGISIEELTSKNRSAELALARQVAMYLARNKTNESLQQIAYAFNKKG